MSVDKEKLGRLAMLATKSKWTTDDLNEVMSAKSDQLNGGYIIADCQGPDRWRNANFIAAANPETILALLYESESLTKDAERYRWLRERQLPLDGHDFLSTQEILDRRIDELMTKEKQP